MSVSEYSRNCFLVDVYVPASESPTQKALRIRRKLRATTKTEAEKLAVEIEHALRLHGVWNEDESAVTLSFPPQGTTPYGAWPATNSKTLGAALTLAWNDLEEGWARNRDGLNSFKSAKEAIMLVGGPDMPCARIRREHYGILREALEKRNLAMGTVNRHMQSLNRVLYFAEREGWIRSRPKFKRPKVSNQRLFTFDDEQIVDSLAYFKAIRCDDMHDLYLIGVDCGLRLGEMLAIEASNVDVRQGLLRVDSEVAKNGERRFVVLTPRVLDMLKARIKTTKQGERLFKDWSHRKTTWRMDGLREHLGVTDTDCVFHSTRHTCGTRMALAGVPLNVMMEQLGHKRPEMSMRYIHSTASQRKKVILEALAS